MEHGSRTNFCPGQQEHDGCKQEITTRSKVRLTFNSQSLPIKGAKTFYFLLSPCPEDFTAPPQTALSTERSSIQTHSHGVNSIRTMALGTVHKMDKNVLMDRSTAFGVR